MDVTLSNKICEYINDNIRSKYKNNYEFAASAGIDEKMIRLILKGDSNLSLDTFKKICDSQNVKMSTVLKAVGE